MSTERAEEPPKRGNSKQSQALPYDVEIAGFVLGGEVSGSLSLAFPDAAECNSEPVGWRATAAPM